MRILVTGGLGFVGRYVVKAYQDAGHEVVVVDYDYRHTPLPSGVRVIAEDINNPETNEIDRLFREWRPEVVNHLAANPSIPFSIQFPAVDADTNVGGTINLLELSKEYGVKQFIFASSSEVYGPTDRPLITEDDPLDPQSPYAIGKMAGEHYVRFFAKQAGFVWTIFRYANIYGPGQTVEGGAVVPRFVHSVLTGQEVTLNNGGTATRDFVYVEDIAHLNLLALDHSGTFCIGSGYKVSIRDLLGIIEGCAGKKGKTVQTERYADFEASALSTSRAKNILHWQPVWSLSGGLYSTVKAMEQLLEQQHDHSAV